MKKTQKDFFRRDENDRQLLIENTWCENCKEADLGLTEPIEYEQNSKLFVEGKCSKCGTRVVSEIIEIQSNKN